MCVWITVGERIRRPMISQGLAERNGEVDSGNPSPVAPAANLLPGSRTKVDFPNLISRLMEGEDPEVLRREYGSELVEEAISVLGEPHMKQVNTALVISLQYWER